MRGRRPTPTSLKVLMGEPNLSRRNYNEPMPAGNIEAPPEWLNAEEKAEWLRMTAAAPGLWTSLDQALLAAYVCATVTHREAHGQLRKQRSLLGKKAGRYLAIRDKEASVLKSLAAELGASPLARPRIPVSQQRDRASEFEKLMG